MIIDIVQVLRAAVVTAKDVPPIGTHRNRPKSLPVPRRAAKLARPSHIAAAAKPQQGKALSSPPAAGGGVTLGVHTRTNSLARRSSGHP